MVGVTGFEPATPCSQSTCATELRYTPLGFVQARSGDADYYTKPEGLRQHPYLKIYHVFSPRGSRRIQLPIFSAS